MGNLSALLAASAIIMVGNETGYRKMTPEEAEQEDAKRADQYERQREARKTRIEAERHAEEARRRLTTDAEWQRIARDEKRRADKKAAKKRAAHPAPTAPEVTEEAGA